MDTISRQRAALAFVVLSVLSVGGAAALRRHEATPALGAAAEPRAGGEAARAREADGPLDAAADARATARLAMSAAQASADETYVAEAVSEHAARAENREQAFRVDVTRGRLEVASHAAEGATPGFELTLGLVAAGREGETLDVTPARTATEGNQIRVLREGLLEWFVNGPLGLEQGFELSERPAGEGPLRFELEVEGLRPEARGSFIALLDEAGVQQARYSDLYALDAEGDDVPAHMHVSDGRIVLEVDDRNARYPLVVDPLVSTQEARLAPSDLANTGRFGASVAATTTSVQGTWAVVGAPYDDGAASNAGAAYVYRRNAADNGWDLIARIQANDAEADAHFGAAVAVGSTSSTQVRVLVGAPDRAAGGKVYAFTYTSATLALTTSAFTAPTPAAGDEYGAALTYNYIVGATAFAVGAPGISNDRGSVFVYRTNALEATLTAGDAADGDRFGAVLPPTFSYTGALLVGAPSDDAGATANAGSVYSFVRAAGPPIEWSQEAKVTHGSPVANGAFGTSLAVISDTQFLTGEPGRTNGAVHRLARAGGSLTLAGSLTAADGQANDGFGTCVAFQDDGTADHVVVGARGVMFNRGALYRYTMDAAFAFTSVERFLGAVGGDAAGSACALPYRNGTAPEVALYGAPFHDADAFDAGIVYGENFTTNNAETALRPDGVASNRFGERVAIDGNTAAIGAPNDDEAAPNGGAVYVFVRSGTSWAQQAKLTVAGVQLAGGSVALEGNTLAFSTRNGTANTVWISRRTGSTWSAPTALTPMGGAVGDAFGASLGLSNGSLVVGAPGVNGGGSDRGAAYVFVDSGTTFTQQGMLVAGNPQDLDSLGSAVLSTATSSWWAPQPRRRVAARWLSASPTSSRAAGPRGRSRPCSRARPAPAEPSGAPWPSAARAWPWPPPPSRSAASPPARAACAPSRRAAPLGRSSTPSRLRAA
ncbi:MAG: hypothetical protein IPI43_13235 [Sandaracinaceae bacterium]|nr:hypothetical protein [Sandaracinaceae bacterium]